MLLNIENNSLGFSKITPTKGVWHRVECFGLSNVLVHGCTFHKTSVFIKKKKKKKQ